MHDVLGAVARPFHVGLAGSQRCAHAVHAWNECAIGTQHVVHGTAHAGHDLHVDGDVRRVGQFHADVRDWRAQRAHREWHDVHGAAAHAAIEQAVQGVTHFARLGPVICRTGRFLRCRADIRAVFDTGHVARVGAGQVGIRALVGIELFHGAAGNHFGAQALVLFLRTIAPVNAVWLGERGNVGHPVDQFLLFNISWNVECGDATHDGLIHITSNTNKRNSGRSGKTGSIVERWLRLTAGGVFTRAGLWCRVRRGARAGGIYLDHAPGLQEQFALSL
ncbi:hypothetical protein D3C72_1434320 [compost metagenome]